MQKVLRSLKHVLVLVALTLTVAWLVGGRTITWTTSLESTADAAHIFQHLTEPELIKQWVDGVVEIEPLTETRRQVGARRRIVVEERQRRYEMHDEVTEYEQDRLLALRVDSPMYDATVTFIIEQQGRFNRVQQRLELRYKGLRRFISPFLTGHVQRQLDADFEELATRIED